MNDEAFYIELVNDFINDYDDRSEILSQNYSNRDWKNYEINVHSLKSSARTIGIFKLFESAKAMEQAAMNRNEALLDSKHGILLDEYRIIVDELKNCISN